MCYNPPRNASFLTQNGASTSPPGTLASLLGAFFPRMTCDVSRLTLLIHRPSCNLPPPVLHSPLSAHPLSILHPLPRSPRFPRPIFTCPSSSVVLRPSSVVRRRPPSAVSRLQFSSLHKTKTPSSTHREGGPPRRCRSEPQTEGEPTTSRAAPTAAQKTTKPFQPTPTPRSQYPFYSP